MEVMFYLIGAKKIVMKFLKRTYISNCLQPYRIAHYMTVLLQIYKHKTFHNFVLLLLFYVYIHMELLQTENK